jgi:hypothetical protein
LETLSKADNPKVELGGSDAEDNTYIGTSGYSSANKNNLNDITSSRKNSNIQDLI